MRHNIHGAGSLAPHRGAHHRTQWAQPIQG